MPTTPDTPSIVALDVGNKRVGVAVASMAARLPRPLATLERGEKFFNELDAIIKQENATVLVVGLPRGLEGQHTGQTRVTEQFIAELKEHTNLPVHTQDEALTSKQAEDELQGPQPIQDKGKVDALAATYILEDYLSEHVVTQRSEAR